MIPVAITAELQSLKAQISAAQPVKNATRATVTAMQLNAGLLVGDVQAALTAASMIDTWAAPVDAPSIVVGFLGVAEDVNDQATLALMRGLVGRVAINLDQI